MRKGFFSLRAGWILPALVVTTLTLGVSGWMAEGLGFNEALYRAVCLFDVGNEYYLQPAYGGWRFQLGRWTGVASLFGAAFFAVAIVLQERLALMVARWVRQQVIVIGSEGIATKAFEAARKARKSVVWLGASALSAGSARSIALPWPPEDPAMTVASHAGGADHVLVAHDDDAKALVLARAARQAAPRAFITVLMHDSYLAEDAAATLNEARTRVLSVAAVSARALHIENPPFLVARQAGHQRIHALITGFGQTGQAIARDLIVNCRTTFLDTPRITVIDPRASMLKAVLRVRAPEIDACAQFTFLEGQIGADAMQPDPDALARALGEAGPLTVAYVCVETDAQALGSAAMLQSLLRSIDVAGPPVYMRLRDTSAVTSSASGGRGLDALIPFGDLDAVLTASEFLSNTPDAAARTFCAAYRAALPAEQRDDPDNRSARPWDELDETWRQANRDAVAHIPAKMASAGLDPATWRGLRGLPRLAPDQALFRDDAECELIARLEHERWNAQRRMDGWRWAPIAKKDEARRLHPSLRAYDLLTEAVKEYDRVYVRETQAACRAATSAES